MLKKFSYLLFAVAALAVAVPVSFAQNYANESTDWGISPTSELTTTYHGKTPTTVPGAKTILTEELKAMLDSPNPPLLLDVLAGGTRKSVIRGATYIGSRAGDGNVFFAEKRDFARMLSAITNGDKNRQVVFYCLSSECWLSYNASIRAVSEGYQNVLYYRGGVYAWQAAGYPLEKVDLYKWPRQ